MDVLTFKNINEKSKSKKINLTVYNENYTCEYGGLEPLVHLLYIPSSTLVGNTQIKLMLHEYNLQHYSCDLIYIVALNVFTSFDNQSHNTPIKMYTILTNRVQALTLDAIWNEETYLVDVRGVEPRSYRNTSYMLLFL